MYSFGIRMRAYDCTSINSINIAFDAQLQSGDRWVAVAPPDGSAVLALVAPKPDAKEYKLIGRTTGVVFVTEDLLGKYQE
jgi:hypothetical protein